MTLEDVLKLLPVLKQNDVHRFKLGDVEIEFQSSKDLKPQAIASPPQSSKDELVDVDETQIPADLRTDAINNVDAILNWSASPSISDQGESPIPLTGEEPLQ